MKSAISIAVLALCAATHANAQSNVTIYGLLDTGIEFLNHVGPKDTSLARMPNITGSVPSRFGLRGTEDLGDGIKASFVLESGIAIDSGGLNYGGRLFGRQALVALSSQYGTLTLGRQYNMTFYALIDSDTLGPNIYAMSNLDSYLPNTRSDNAVGYMNKSGAFSYGATYSLGRDAAGPGGPQATNCAGESAVDRNACRQMTAMLKYTADNNGVSASYDKLYGGTGALFGLNNSRFSDTRSTFSGFVKLGTVKITGGIVHRKNDSVASFTSDLVHIGAYYPVGTNWAFDGQVAKLNVQNSANDAVIFAARATYNFSRRTSAYLTAGHINNSGLSAIAVSPGATNLAGMDQSGIMLGLRHGF